jgi:hypothetical protein
MNTIQSTKTTETSPDDPETLALAGLGAMLAAPRTLVRFGNPAGLPAVHRATVFFDGRDGAGGITGAELFSPDFDQLLESDDAETVLEATVPPGGVPGLRRALARVRPADSRVALGALLDEAVLGLLDSLHPGWPDDEGTCGEVEIHWLRSQDPAAPPLVAIGVVVSYRSLVSTTYPFRAMESSPIRTSAVS